MHIHKGSHEFLIFSKTFSDKHAALKGKIPAEDTNGSNLMIVGPTRTSRNRRELQHELRGGESESEGSTPNFKDAQSKNFHLPAPGRLVVLKPGQQSRSLLLLDPQ